MPSLRLPTQTTCEQWPRWKRVGSMHVRVCPAGRRDVQGSKPCAHARVHLGGSRASAAYPFASHPFAPRAWPRSRLQLRLMLPQPRPCPLAPLSRSTPAGCQRKLGGPHNPETAGRQAGPEQLRQGPSACSVSCAPPTAADRAVGCERRARGANAESRPWAREALSMPWQRFSPGRSCRRCR